MRGAPGAPAAHAPGRRPKAAAWPPPRLGGPRALRGDGDADERRACEDRRGALRGGRPQLARGGHTGPSTAMIGETLSHYRILSRIGGGGMGVVYEAEDTRLRRHVALKLLPDPPRTHPPALERFRREARAASTLNHPNICVIHEVGEDAGRPFIVMERMEGHTLRHIIGGQPVELERLVEMGLQLADALEAAHAKGIVHRDVKPANIFVTERGQAKLLDFGLARQTGSHALDPEGATASQLDLLTGAGTLVGTVAYMSPEQARGQELDARTDLFSFGTVLYEMATGVPPFAGQSTGGVLEA